MIRPLLGKKRRVLRSSGPCHQDRLLAYWFAVCQLSWVYSLPAQRSKGMSSLVTDLTVYAKILCFIFYRFPAVFPSTPHSNPSTASLFSSLPSLNPAGDFGGALWAAFLRVQQSEEARASVPQQRRRLWGIFLPHATSAVGLCWEIPRWISNTICVSLLDVLIKMEIPWELIMWTYCHVLMSDLL